MPRELRSATLETRSGRLRLTVRKKPYALRIGPGLHLTYRRNAGAGRWSVKARDGRGGYWLKAFAHADDFEVADGVHTLDFWQAIERARSLARAAVGESAKPITITQALERYEDDLRTRDGALLNVTRIKHHLTPALAAKLVNELTVADLRRYRDGLVKKGLSRDSANRTARAFKACLNLAANSDPGITSRAAWRLGLAGLPDSGRSRNVILDDATVLKVVEAAYQANPEFGLFVEVGAITGARPSQIARLRVQDLIDGAAPRLMMPRSRKGRGHKADERHPLPIPLSLSAKLKHAASGRAVDAPLLLKRSGGRWAHSDHRKPFGKTIATVGLDPGEVTLYALRHSAIVRALLVGVPIRVVAAGHDTSAGMIERTYSKYIADHSDALTRRAMLDPSALGGGNVIPIAR